MQADEEDTPEERKLLRQIAKGSKIGPELVKQLTQMAGARKLADLGLAGQLLRQGLSREERLRLLELYVGMMIADGFISIPEQHAIRFLADLFEISPGRLNQVYQDATGRSMPDIGDPSSLNWWKRKEQKQHSSKEEQRSKESRDRDKRREKHRSNRKGKPMTQTRALAILGLEGGASTQDIKEAYRHLAKVHHPDRYQRLGPEAVQTATETFQRINAAYDYLT